MADKHQESKKWGEPTRKLGETGVVGKMSEEELRQSKPNTYNSLGVDLGNRYNFLFESESPKKSETADEQSEVSDTSEKERLTKVLEQVVKNNEELQAKLESLEERLRILEQGTGDVASPVEPASVDAPDGAPEPASDGSPEPASDSDVVAPETDSNTVVPETDSGTVPPETDPDANAEKNYTSEVIDDSEKTLEIKDGGKLYIDRSVHDKPGVLPIEIKQTDGGDGSLIIRIASPDDPNISIAHLELKPGESADEDAIKKAFGPMKLLVNGGVPFSLALSKDGKELTIKGAGDTRLSIFREVQSDDNANVAPDGDADTAPDSDADVEPASVADNASDSEPGGDNASDSEPGGDASQEKHRRRTLKQWWSDGKKVFGSSYWAAKWAMMLQNSLAPNESRIDYDPVTAEKQKKRRRLGIMVGVAALAAATYLARDQISDFANNIGSGITDALDGAGIGDGGDDVGRSVREIHHVTPEDILGGYSGATNDSSVIEQAAEAANGVDGSAAAEAVNDLTAEQLSSFYNIPYGTGGEALFQRMGLDPREWYSHQEEILKRFSDSFYRMSDGNVGIARPGILPDDVINYFEALRK